MTQADLTLTAPTAKRRAAEIEQGDREEWLDRAMLKIAQLPRGDSFTADDLHGELPEPPHPNLWGTLFRLSTAGGTIRSVGFQAIQAARASRWGGAGLEATMSERLHGMSLTEINRLRAELERLCHERNKWRRSERIATRTLTEALAKVKGERDEARVEVNRLRDERDALRRLVLALERVAMHACHHNCIWYGSDSRRCDCGLARDLAALQETGLANLFRKAGIPATRGATMSERDQERRLDGEALASFERYAQASRTEPDGTKCQWADYALRLVAEVRELREGKKKSVEAGKQLDRDHVATVRMYREEIERQLGEARAYQAEITRLSAEVENLRGLVQLSGAAARERWMR